MTGRPRVQCQAVAAKVMSAEDAAAFITPGDRVGMSGFTGFGHPKAVPTALVRRAADGVARGDRFAVSVWTGSSTAPELDGALAAVDGIDLRMPYRAAVHGYLDRATATGPGKHTPHLLGEALSWHMRYLTEGTMRR